MTIDGWKGFKAFITDDKHLGHKIRRNIDLYILWDNKIIKVKYLETIYAVLGEEEKASKYIK